MSNFQQWTGQTVVWPSLFGSTPVHSGDIADFGATPVPLSYAGVWASNAGPATIGTAAVITPNPQLPVVAQVYNPGTGAPTTGAYSAGMECVDSTGAVFVCTASGTPGTWVAAGYMPVTQTVNSGIGAPKIARQVSDPNLTESKWREVYESGTFNSHADPVRFWGWNADKGAGGGDSAAPCWYVGMEANYWETSSSQVMEWYLQYTRANGTGGLRPVMVNVSRDPAKDFARVAMDIGTDASPAGTFSVLTGGAPLFQVAPEQSIFYKPVYLSAASGVNSTLVMNATNASARASWQDAGAFKWTFYSNSADPSLYLYDEVNAKVVINFVPGPGAVGGTTYLQSGVRIGGNVGFFNTTPIAKPTVTGTKGSNAALASLLTALAAYGLILDSSTT